MLVTTSDSVAGHEIGETLGLVRGKAMWSRDANRSGEMGVRHLLVTGVQDMELALDEARERATETARRSAQLMEADAVVGLRLEVVELTSGTFMVFAWGTAVKAAKQQNATPAMQAEGDEEPGADYACRHEPSSTEGSSLHH